MFIVTEYAALRFDFKSSGVWKFELSPMNMFGRYNEWILKG